LKILIAMQLLLPLTALATVASATVGILLPIYRYPLNDGKLEWDAVAAVAGTHSTLPFYVIVNNERGAPYPQNPPPNMIDWADPLGALNSKSNVRTLGYIATTFGARDIAEVKRGIDQYAVWTTQTGWSGAVNDVSLDGVFFDEIDTDPQFLDYNREISQYARTVLSARPGATGAIVVLNPGVPVNSDSYSLFDVADAIVQIETCHAPNSAAGGALDPDGKPRCPVTPPYTPFKPESLDAIRDEHAARSAVIVHDFYDSWEPYTPAPLATLEADVNAIVQKGVHSFYVTQYGYTANFTQEPASIGTVAKLAAQAQGLS
jgi:hypothetical protein